MSLVDLGALLLLGLVSSTHCLAMCGAFVICMDRRSRTAAWTYQAGRGATYALLGAGLALFSVGLRVLISPALGRWVLIVAGVLMICLGLAQGGLVRLPSLGEGRLRRALGRLLGAQSPFAPLGLGMFTGLLPCPMLYAALLRATVAASPFDGALGMAAFWVGTLPAMAGLTLLDGWLGRHGRQWWPRVALAVTVALGGITLYSGLAPGSGPEPVCPHCAE